MVNDPISMAVEEHRAKLRANSTLKATKNLGLTRQPINFLTRQNSKTANNDGAKTSMG